MKKIIIVLLMVFFLAGCTPKEEGSILEPVGVTSPLVVADIPEEKIVNIDTGAQIETDVFFDNYAGFSVPYPKDWLLTQHSPNFITFSGPDAQISISHNLMSDPLTDDYKSFKDSYKATLKNELIRLDSDTWQRRENQSISSQKIVSKDPLLIAETYDNLKVSNDINDYVSGVYCEKRYYLSYNNINTLISVVSKSQDNYEILDYIVSNLKTIPIKYDSSVIVAGVAFPGTFKKNSVKLGDINGVSYTPTENDAFTGCFVQIYKGRTDINDEILDMMFGNAFYQTFDNGYNDGDTLLCATHIGYSGMGIDATINTDSLYSTLKTGTAYKLEIYQSADQTIIIGYPAVKTQLIELLVEN